MSEYKDMLKEARELADLIASSLPERVQIAALTLKSKIPFKALSTRELLIHRVSPLASAAIDLLEKNQIVPGVVLARAVVETVAVVFSLHERLDRFFENNNVIELDKDLMNCMLGSRNNTGTRAAINIFNSIDRVDRSVPGFRSGYDSLCEYTHPNWAGTLGAYGQIDNKQFELRLGPTDRSNGLTIGAFALVESLTIFESYYTALGESILKLNDYFDKN